VLVGGATACGASEEDRADDAIVCQTDLASWAADIDALNSWSAGRMRKHLDDYVNTLQETLVDTAELINRVHDTKLRRGLASTQGALAATKQVAVDLPSPEIAEMFQGSVYTNGLAVMQRCAALSGSG